jgi:hypothetical protein
MLGPVYAVYRPLAALLTGILGGALVSAFEDGKSGEGGPGTSGNSRCTDGCEWEDKTGSAIGRALRYGFVTLPRDIAKPLLAGIAIAGLISGLIEKDALASYLGGGFVSMLVMMAFGIPLYVCSTASIPIAVGFMHLGASPGAALVFLITGPATNAATLSVVWNLLGRRTTAIYLLTIALGSLAAGYSLDLIYRLTDTGYVMTEHVHTEGGGWVEPVSAVALLGVLVGSLIPRKSDPRGEAKAGVEQLTLNVSGMRCSHCADTIARALKEAPGVLDARVDLRKGKAVISGKDLNREALIASVRDLGYGALLREE